MTVNSALSTCVVAGEQLVLLAEKAIWWERESTLIITDVHVGKAAHFRKNGIALPKRANDDNLWRLSVLLQQWQPKTLIVLGDLVHSRLNAEWTDFVEMMRMFPSTSLILVQGNHDVLEEESWNELPMHVVATHVQEPFLFCHDPSEITTGEGYVLSGHIHPSVRLRGGARQKLVLPCFWFGSRVGVLPSFGYFTGHYCITPAAGDEVFVVADSSVLRVSDKIDLAK
ncbi:MAG: ligase-associated damage response endonuclease PdeM [Bacteroidota bacterium]